MFLNVNLAVGVIPHGTEMSGMAIGVYQAQYMAETLWYGFWGLTLLNGFWVLFSTQLGDTDVLIRTMTDVVWLGDERVRKWGGGRIKMVYYVLLVVYTFLAIYGGGRIKMVYYVLLVVYTFLAIYAAGLATPLTLFKIVANMGGLVMVLGGIQIFIVNRKFLPDRLQPPLWRQAGLLACVAFYAFFAVRVFLSLVWG